MSDDGRHVLVPPGEDVYMRYKLYSDFLVHGDITDDWIEFDNARIPLLYCCK